VYIGVLVHTNGTDLNYLVPCWIKASSLKIKDYEPT